MILLLSPEDEYRRRLDAAGEKKKKGERKTRGEKKGKQFTGDYEVPKILFHSVPRVWAL